MAFGLLIPGTYPILKRWRVCWTGDVVEKRDMDWPLCELAMNRRAVRWSRVKGLCDRVIAAEKEEKPVVRDDARRKHLECDL